MKYEIVTVGGTFDHFHKGHQELLRQAFEYSQKVVIGVTSDEFAKMTRKDNLIGSFASHKTYLERRTEVANWVHNQNLRERVELVQIEDMFGPLREVKSENLPARNDYPPNRWVAGRKVRSEIEAMVVTEQTRSNAQEINAWRQKRGLAPLDILQVSLVLAEDGKPIASQRIRAGEISREGLVYKMHRLWGKLPEGLRPELRKPLGKIVNSQGLTLGGRRNLIITVGDVSTITVIASGIKPDIAVFDLLVRREKIYNNPADVGCDSDYEIVKLTNPAGYIAKEVVAFFWAQNLQKKKRLALWIDGEEDLVTLPAIVCTPLGTTVIYGQPPITTKGGIVVAPVTEELKEDVFNLVQKFEQY